MGEGSVAESGIFWAVTDALDAACDPLGPEEAVRALAVAMAVRAYGTSLTPADVAALIEEA
jgi:hypothetical protein